MRILIIHQNFPGQFRHMAQHWAQCCDWEIRAIGRDTAPGLTATNIELLRYPLHRSPRKDQHPYLRQMEGAVLHGQGAARCMLQLKQQGFTPDIILAHPGWGETLYAKDVFPDARLIHLCEWYYNATVENFDPEFPFSFDSQARIRTWNALHMLNLENCDAGICPTQWQLQQHPQTYRNKISLIHEGIDTALLGPDPHVRITTPSGQTLRAGDPVVTYVARNLEPYRGFHIFMRMLAKLQQREKNFHTLIVGGDGVSYGKRPQDAANWREKLQREVALDPQRTHFLGKLPYDVYRQVLQVSAAHVYLTYPFVLSWSMLEAMASACLVVASRTPPVEEVLRHEHNGLLVDFFDLDAMADQLEAVLASPQSYRPLRLQAQRDAQAYSLEKGMQAYEALLLQHIERSN